MTGVRGEDLLADEITAWGWTLTDTRGKLLKRTVFCDAVVDGLKALGDKPPRSKHQWAADYYGSDIDIVRAWLRNASCLVAWAKANSGASQQELLTAIHSEADLVQFTFDDVQAKSADDWVRHRGPSRFRTQLRDLLAGRCIEEGRWGSFEAGQSVPQGWIDDAWPTAVRLSALAFLVPARRYVAVREIPDDRFIELATELRTTSRLPVTGARLREACLSEILDQPFKPEGHLWPVGLAEYTLRSARVHVLGLEAVIPDELRPLLEVVGVWADDARNTTSGGMVLHGMDRADAAQAIALYATNLLQTIYMGFDPGFPDGISGETFSMRVSTRFGGMRRTREAGGAPWRPPEDGWPPNGPGGRVSPDDDGLEEVRAVVGAAQELEALLVDQAAQAPGLLGETSLPEEAKRVRVGMAASAAGEALAKCLRDKAVEIAEGGAKDKAKAFEDVYWTQAVALARAAGLKEDHHQGFERIARGAYAAWLERRRY